MLNMMGIEEGMIGDHNNDGHGWVLGGRGEDNEHDLRDPTPLLFQAPHEHELLEQRACQ